VFRYCGTLCCIKYINLMVVSCEEDVCIIPRAHNVVIVLFNRTQAIVDFPSCILTHTPGPVSSVTTGNVA